MALSFADRAAVDNLPPLATYLLSLISIKQSNLCVSADVHTTRELLQIAEEVGDAICVLKTHADIIDDFGERTIRGLQEIARRKHFLLFEDRKLGDIGNTVQSQYARGPLRIAKWAHLVNAHLLPGPAIVPALQAAAHSSLLSVNQSTITTITTGQPRVEDAARSTVDTARNTPSTTSIDSSTQRVSTSSVPPISQRASAANASEDVNLSHGPKSPSYRTAPCESQSQSMNPDDESNIIFRHHRTSSTSLCATTTISQTFEPTSPRPRSTASILKKLSMPQAEHEFDEEPQQVPEEDGNTAPSTAKVKQATTGTKDVVFSNSPFSESTKKPSISSSKITVSRDLPPTSPLSAPPLSPFFPPVQTTVQPTSPLNSPAVLAALEALGPAPHARGLLLLAQMSSAGNLATAEYTASCVAAARAHKQFVLGYVAQESLNDHDVTTKSAGNNTAPATKDSFIHFTPGVNLPPEEAEGNEVTKGDGKGQQYRRPEDVLMGERGVDVVIVGRGILGAEDREREAERYRRACWACVEGRGEEN